MNDLLISEGKPRKRMQNPSFKLAGFAECKHTTHKQMAVLVYAEGLDTQWETIPADYSEQEITDIEEDDQKEVEKLAREAFRKWKRKYDRSMKKRKDGHRVVRRPRSRPA